MHDLVHIAKTCAMVNEALHQTSGKDGQSCLERALFWVWGRCLLRIYENSESLWREKWVNFFRRRGLLSDTYCIDRLDMPNVVYVKLSLEHTKAYVGSAKHNMVHREASRRRAFSNGDKSRRVEPAFKWWELTESYWNFCPLVLLMCDSHIDAQENEIKVSNIRKPELVAPYIWKFLPQKQVHIAKPDWLRNNWHSTAAANTWKYADAKPWNDPRLHQVWKSITELAQKGGPANERI